MNGGRKRLFRARCWGAVTVVAVCVVAADTASAAVSPPSLNGPIVDSRDVNQGRRIFRLDPALSPGGGRIVVAGDLGANVLPSLWQLDARGQADRLGDGRDPAVSPDATTVAYAVGTTLWTRDLVTDDRRELVSPVDCADGLARPSWSPDGRFIAFEIHFVPALPPGTCSMPLRGLAAVGRATYTVFPAHLIAVVPSGGGAYRLYSGASGYLPYFSPDGTRITYVDRPFWGRPSTGLLNVRSGRAVTLAPGADSHWSPSGRMVAVVDGRGGVRTFDRDGGNIHWRAGSDARWSRCGLVTATKGTVAASDDGHLIAVATRTGVSARRCGVAGARMVAGTGWEPVSFSPRGMRLLVRRCVGQRCRLAIVGASRTVPLKSASIKSAPPADLSAVATVSAEPTWSRDGTQLALLATATIIAIADTRTGATLGRFDDAGALVETPQWLGRTLLTASSASGRRGGLSYVDPRTGRTTAVAATPTYARLSPDGTTLAYVDPSESPGIRLRRDDGTTGIVPQSEAVGSTFAWSPDGAYLAAPVADTVQTIDLTGRRTVVVRLPPNEPRPHVLDWSPDGDWIAYTRGPYDPDGEVWVVHPDGTGTHRLLDLVPLLLRWSPDGKTIAYADRHGVYSLRADGTNLTALSSATACLAWAPDSRHLLLTTPTPDADAVNLHVMDTNGPSFPLLVDHPVEVTSCDWR